MLADPQTVTVGATPVALPRTGISGTNADYTSADGAYRLRVMQTSNSTTRRTSITLQSNKIAVDPLMAVNTRRSDLIGVSITAPLDGFTITEQKDQVVALCNLLTSSSAATLVKILGGEK